MDKTIPKKHTPEPAKVDEKLWQECQQITAGKKADHLPQILGTIANGIMIVLVDGDTVKIHFDMDFVEGNNGMESPEFIPKDQIWLDANLAQHDWAPVLYHEAHEYRDMRTGMSYEKAHARANAGEKAVRIRLAKAKPESANAF